MNECVRDVVVVGSGPAGLAAAIVYGSAGFKTATVDTRPSSAGSVNDFQVVAFTSSSRDRLIDLGLWLAIADAVWPIHGVRVHDADTGRAHVFRAQRTGHGALLYAISYGKLRDCLARLAASLKTIEPIRGRRLAALPLDGTARRVVLDDGSVLRARLVVGADGRRSTVRELAGLSCRATGFAESALTFSVAGSGLETDTAIERVTSSGPISVLPLSEDRFAVGWIDTATRTERRQTSAPKRLLAELTNALEVRSSHRLKLASKVTAQRLSVASADRCVAPRLVLIGDAAHGGHPIPVQGAHMALADVHELTTLARVDRARFASADTLAAFQRNRRLANAARLGVVDVLNRMFPAAAAPISLASPKPATHSVRAPTLAVGVGASP